MANQPAPYIESLTEREQEILRLLAANLTDLEIANQLVIGRTTVRFHNRNIYAKLGVTNRDSAVTHAQALGLLTATETEFASVEHNLPAQTTPFIGRQHELIDLAELLTDNDVRLVTVLAPGGMGKTRLALQVAEYFTSSPQSSFGWSFPNGVYFVPLASLDNSANIVSAIAKHTGYQFQHDGRDPKHQLLDYFQEKTLLVVLDNFEHLLDGAEIVTDILQAARNVTVMATSRERLSLQGETVYGISGMALPDWNTPEDALEYDVVKLFIQSAKRAKPDFQLQMYELNYLARICQLTGGMPLAIVLAAAWVDMLSLDEIAAEIQQNVDFLAVELRDVPRRQWNIRAVFEPTWKRLTEDEKDVFMRLSVFRGGFKRDAAEQVTGMTLWHLQILMSKGLLTRRSNGRYEIHELLRQYAEGHLATSGDGEAVRDAHSEYYMTMLAAREDDIWTSRLRAAIDEIETDIENVRVAWVWAYTHHKLSALRQSITSLYWLYWISTRYDEGLEIFRDTARALQMDEPTGEQGIVFAHALSYQASFEAFGGNWEVGVLRLTTSVAILRKLGARLELVAPGLVYMVMFGALPDFEEAKETCLEIIRVCEEHDLQWGIAGGLIQLGDTYQRHGKIEEARHHLHEALAIYRKINSPMGIVWGSGYLVSIALATKDYPAASKILTENASGWLALGIKSNYAGSLDQLGWVTQAQGFHAKASEYYREGREVFQALGLKNRLVWSYRQQGLQTHQQGNHDKAKQLLELGVTIARDTGNGRLIADILNKQGQITAALDESEDARGHYLEALQLAQDSGAPVWFFLESISGLAMLKGQSGEQARAVEWLSMTLHHPQNAVDVKELAETYLAALESNLSLDDFAAAVERGKTLDLKEVLVELEKEA